MRVSKIAGALFFTVVGGLFLFSGVPAALADNFTIYSQPDDSGEMVSLQATSSKAWISSASLGNLFLGKGSLFITFTMKDLHASTVYHSPFGGVALGTCPTCEDLQKYYFTDADRAILLDGAFHTFTVQTGTTTRGTADGETPIYIKFFSLSQYYLGTHLKSNAAGTIPAITIESASPPALPPVPQAPEGSVMVYEQSDASGVMTSSQPKNQSAYVDSASLGNLPLGQGPLYLTFTIKSPHLGTSMPGGVCIEPMSTHCAYGSNPGMQKYFFTAADRALLSDGAFHTFTVLTGSTTSSYADGTRPVNIGFFGLYQVPGDTKIRSNADATIPYLKIKKPPPSDPCAKGGCISNVLFLPGIEASRLAEDLPCTDGVCSTKLWEPGGDALASRLAHDASGASVNADIYATSVIDNAYVPIKGNIYKSFIEQMNGLVATGTIKAWEAIPYDWRLAPNQILSSGALIAPSKVSYLIATSSPYIIQELKRLAASSKTGKVTIIAHSNGGLLTKALTNKLGADAAKYIDKIIFIAVPQAGTPQAIGALLHGYEQGLPMPLLPYALSSSMARELAANMPMTYNLLPSASYFTQVDDPVATFADQPFLADFRARYGSFIHSQERLHTFISDTGRSASSTTEGLNYPSVGNEPLLTTAEALHTSLDAWAPPTGVALYEIAGWGEKTLAGIDYYQGTAMHCDNLISVLSGCTRTPKIEYRPRLTLDGDGTVVAPSALWTPGSKRYWVDLKDYNGFFGTTKHASVLEVPQLRTFIQNLLTNNDNAILPQYISTSTPINSHPNPETELHFTLHSPLSLDLYDDMGRHTGISTTTGELEENIPESRYLKFGEVQFISAPASLHTRLVMDGYATGSFTLEAEEVNGETVIASTTFSGIPTTANAIATIDLPAGGLANAGTLVVDENGDGRADVTLAPKLGAEVEPDITAPEMQITFSTTTKALAFIGTDDSDAVTVTSTTTYPMFKKDKREKNEKKDDKEKNKDDEKSRKGTAVTTVTARDAAGNTTVLTYTEQLPSSDERDTITLQSLAYNGATTTLKATKLQYKWDMSKKEKYMMFDAYIATASSTIEAHYQSKKNITTIMARPHELDDHDDDDDEEEDRPVRNKLPGLVIPSLQTEEGSVKITY